MKVLIIRFSSIGDIVLTTPVIRCLKHVRGLNAEVHFATKKTFAGILESNPNVDMVHVLDDSIIALIKRLRSERFDLVIDLHNNLRSALIKIALLKPSRSFRKLNMKKWMLTRFKINRLPQIHIVDRYLETVSHLGVANDGKGLDYFIPLAEQRVPNGIPNKFRNAYIAFAIGGKHATKRLPNERIIAICQKLASPVLLLGGAEDQHNGNVIVSACQNQVFNACGLLNLSQSAYMVKNARAVITHDTGLMHIAAAFNKQTISVWGNTVPEFGMYPYMPGHEHLSEIFEVKGLSCRPCSKIGYEKCPKGHFDCMNKINIEKIAERW